MTEAEEIIKKVSPTYKSSGPICEHKLIYDSATDALEPIYFFILDLVNDFGFKTKKITDNFVSTPGGSHFSETGMKAARMQEEAAKMLGNANTVLRSVLNLVYDLRDFKTRIQHYDDLKSSKESTRDAARLALKQIWMDKVDATNKGNSSIKAMAFSQGGFPILIDAFLSVKDPEQAKKLQLNERVKRIVIERIYEFELWLQNSESELRKRYEVEKTYLKSQVNSLKLYSQWAKPYLRAAKQLEITQAGTNPNLVNMFNTVMLELTLMGVRPFSVEDAAKAGDLPIHLAKMEQQKKLRTYNTCILIDFSFRAIPRQGTFSGRAEITFKAYALNDDELKLFDKELSKNDIAEAFKLIEGATTESLEQIQKDIDEFLNEDKKESEKKEKSQEENPFLAIFGYYNTTKEEKKQIKEENKGKPLIVKIKSRMKSALGMKIKSEDGKIKPDNWVEKNLIRKVVAKDAESTCYDLFDVYKKAHRMESFT